MNNTININNKDYEVRLLTLGDLIKLEEQGFNVLSDNNTTPLKQLRAISHLALKHHTEFKNIQSLDAFGLNDIVRVSEISMSRVAGQDRADEGKSQAPEQTV